MNSYEFKISGWINIRANSETEAQEKLERMVAADLTVAELRWKESQLKEIEVEE